MLDRKKENNTVCRSINSPSNFRPLNLGELLTVRFDHNIIQITKILGDAVEHSLASKLLLFTL